MPSDVSKSLALPFPQTEALPEISVTPPPVYPITLSPEESSVVFPPLPVYADGSLKTISVTFAIGSALAAIAGLLLCSSYPQLMPTTGSMPGIKAFTAAVFGGIGSIPGAMLGGVLLGLIEIFGKAYISTELGDAIVFAVLIIVLLVRPTGLLGKPIREKV